ncbi:hypothetical protein VTI74DRAFT_5609 [Chaetomium olivicolor]
MHDNRTHPLLQQVPLTVSPFVNLPSATTLPYQYKPMPSTLPASAAGITATAATTDESAQSASAANKPKYVVSASGHAAHPDEILASCRALQEHVTQLLAKSQQELAELDEKIKARELAEKRRVAPGWLDSEARMLEPERPGSAQHGNVSGGGGGSGNGAGNTDGEQHAQGQQWSIPGSQGFGGGIAGVGDGFGHGRGGASEMAVPDEGAELDRAFGAMNVSRS